MKLNLIRFHPNHRLQRTGTCPQIDNLISITRRKDNRDMTTLVKEVEQVKDQVSLNRNHQKVIKSKLEHDRIRLILNKFIIKPPISVEIH